PVFSHRRCYWQRQRNLSLGRSISCRKLAQRSTFRVKSSTMTPARLKRAMAAAFEQRTAAQTLLYSPLEISRGIRLAPLSPNISTYQNPLLFIGASVLILPLCPAFTKKTSGTIDATLPASI